MLGLFKKREYLEWAEYSAKVRSIDIFYFQQKVRRQSIKNLATL